MISHPLSQARIRATVARANARRFADEVSAEPDEGVKAYLRHLAVSWNGVAEQQEFLIEMEERDANAATPL